MKITDIVHPEYQAKYQDWQKWESVFLGGRQFIKSYLTKFSAREDATDFADRLAISYAPSHAKAAISDIKNSIYQRISDVKRRSTDLTYMDAVVGKGGGVDNLGNTMSGFVGRVILPKLLSIGKVGVYIDKPEQPMGLTLRDTVNIHPYLYAYDALAIKSWSIDQYGRLQNLLLEDVTQVIDETFGLVTDHEMAYRYLRLTPNGVVVTIYNDEGLELSSEVLELDRIPFVIFELSASLLTDIADHQIALLNLASSDMNYTMRANFPFYTEQYAPAAEFANRAKKKADGTTGDDAKTTVGVSQGRRYAKDTERPAFIHPSSEPLLASMEKQKVIREEIYQLASLAVAHLQPVRASAESKGMDERSLEAGLSYIGLELEYGENEIAEIWASYNSTNHDVSVAYPTKYTLRTDSELRSEAKDLAVLMTTIPSKTYQRELAKRIASLTTSHQVDEDTLSAINDEIDAAQVVVTGPDVILKDHEAGFVSTDTASKLRGYAKGEVDQAKLDHAERAARVALAQSSAGARGVADLSAGDASSEKALLRDQGKAV